VSAPRTTAGARVATLREDFDASFVVAPQLERVVTVGLLGVRVGPTSAAIRLEDVAGLHADTAITPLPASPPEFLGLAGFRGGAVPVYDLGSLLGAAGTGRPRWCIVAAGRPPVAFAFDHFDGYLEVPVEALSDTGSGPGPRRDVVTIDGQPRSIVEIGALVAAIAARTR
jgi:purine-binding chemotaxis protein CheW